VELDRWRRRVELDGRRVECQGFGLVARSGERSTTGWGSWGCEYCWGWSAFSCSSPYFLNRGSSREAVGIALTCRPRSCYFFFTALCWIWMAPIGGAIVVVRFSILVACFGIVTTLFHCAQLGRDVLPLWHFFSQNLV
jgi:hypothetical protein